MNEWIPMDENDEFPSLGWDAIDWMINNLAMPDRTEYEPFIPTREQANFLVNLMRVDEVTGEDYVYRRAVYSRPKGAGKSPFMSAIAILFALGPVVPSGFDDDGQPIGRTLNSVRTPLIQLAAVSEDQADNMYTPVLEMLKAGPVMDNYPGLEARLENIALPGGNGTGKIEAVTSSATSREGNRAYMAILDQTESWTRQNKGQKLAKTLRRNASKVNGITLETPNAFIPGEGSVAETTMAYYQKLLEKGIDPMDEGLLVDHIEAPADTDLLDEKSLMKGLKIAYGDSTWVNLERLIEESRDPDVAPEEFRRYYLNQVTAASDSWVSRPEWNAIRDADKFLEPGDQIVLGFDGSRGRRKGHADATALIAMRVSDMCLFPIGIWEQPDNVEDWTPDVQEINDTIREVFNDYSVAAFYADPSGWQEHIARWEAEYSRKVKVKATPSQPFSIWPRGKATNVSHAVHDFRDAILTKEISHNGSVALARHVLNARKRTTGRSGYLLYKEHPDSINKIDAAYASVMAHKAALDVISGGKARNTKKQPRRMRIYR